MRAGSTEPKGTSGQSYVKARLQELGWAVVPNPEHDLGTDLWVQPRDRRFDLGLMLGLQVKNGESYLDYPTTIDGRDGWWLEETRAHLEYWLSHGVPHAVVLRDPKTGMSYWSHVTNDSVTWTGVGGKVFVPRDQVIDNNSLAQLAAVAATVHPRPMWTGSAMAGAPDLYAEDQLRYAMLTPRLVAPHPNSGAKEVEAHEAIALLTEGRFRELGWYGLDKPIAESWRWRLYSAILAFAGDQVVEPLRACVASAHSASDLAAATAALASALLETGDVDGALVVVDEALATDSCAPVDQAWLQVHRARYLSEVGRVQEAIESATQVQSLPAHRPHDVTAAAIAGAGAALVFRASEVFEGDVAATVSARDTESAWWLAQSVSRSLGSLFDESFRAWVDDENQYYFNRDTGEGHMRGVTLVAGFSALQDRWTYSTSLLAQAAFMDRNLDTTQASAHLTSLRRAGNTPAVNGVIHRLLVDGPADAITNAGNVIDVDRLTTTDVSATLELLTRGADILTTEVADRITGWALRPPGDRNPWLERTRANFDVDSRLTDLIRALLPATSEPATRFVLDFIIDQPAEGDGAQARSWSALVNSIPHDEWTPGDVGRLLTRTSDSSDVRDAIRRVGFSRDAAIRSAVLDELRQGNMGSLTLIGPVDDVPEEAVTPLIGVLANAVRSRQDGASQGRIGMGRMVEPERILALLNIAHPDKADWEPLIELLTATYSVSSDLVQVLRILEARGGTLPGDTKDLLVTLIERVRDRQPLRRSFRGDADPRAFAVAALQTLRPGSYELAPSKFGTDRRSRQALTVAIARRLDPRSFETLAMLATDSDAHIRATVAGMLTHWVEKDVHPLALPTVEHLLAQDSGTLVARHVGANLPDKSMARTQPLAETLTLHRSAVARKGGRRALYGPVPTDNCPSPRSPQV